jgi:hypothetical protein
MNLLTDSIVVLGFGLELALLARALMIRATHKFPIFYSYILYIFCAEMVLTFTRIYYLSHYRTVYWFYFLVRTLAAFGVLAEVSDSVFKPFPAVRKLGRLIVILTCVGFVLWFWVPAQWNPQSSSVMFLNLIKTSAFTKALAIAGLFAAARSYRIPLGKHAGGILLGFAAFEAVGLTNFAAATYFGQEVYAAIMSWLTPLSFGVCLAIWTVALWNPDPVMHPQVAGAGTPSPGFQLRRFSTFVTRLLWK